MSTIIEPLFHLFVAPVTGFMAAAFGDGYRAMARHIRIHRARAHLSEMPDYILHDIGISRSEIGSVTRYGETDTSRRVR